MKVVVIQRRTPGSVPTYEQLMELWEKEFHEMGLLDSVTFHRNFTPETLDEIVGDADAVLGMWIQDGAISEEFLSRHPNLKYISTFAHGFGHFDREMTRRHGLTITNTVYGDVTIAQYAMALLLDICHDVSAHDRYYKFDGWKDGTPPTYKALTRQIELYEKTFGVLGLGSIGLWAARMAAGFGMKVIATSRTKMVGPEYDFIEQVSLDELLSRSDVISIHVPMSPESARMIGRDAIAKMKDGVILLNTARGGLIDEEALMEALKSGKIYFAGLDVLTGEPLTERSPLMDIENTRITPHIAWAPAEARYRAVRLAAENFRNWMEGHPTSVVN